MRQLRAVAFRYPAPRRLSPERSDGGEEGRAGIQAALGTAFTYQGHLKKDGTPVNGNCDFLFSLWDAETGGNQIGSNVEKTNVPVSNGLFTVQLDFGSGAFQGDARWLEITIKCAGDLGYVLSPRQLLTPAPYALALPGLRTQQNATSPNIIGGYSGNSVTGGVVGATVGGGGASDYANRVTDNYGTIGGGIDNLVGNVNENPSDVPYATIGGGTENIARGWAATVSGGNGNTASGNFATIGGGGGNIASGPYATVGGGVSNAASGYMAAIGGGWSNTAAISHTVIGGGSGNIANGPYATVGGGVNNVASGYMAAIGGGWLNTAAISQTVIGGGYSNLITGTATYGTIAGGYNITVTGEYAAVGGGKDNTASGVYATIGGGNHNTASGDNRATVGGGGDNVASGIASTVAGGWSNAAGGNSATIGGGVNNTAGGDFATVPGGYGAVASHYGEMAYASGSFTTTGNAQTSLYVMRIERTCTAGTWYDLYLNGNEGGSLGYLTIASGRTIAFDALVVGRTQAGESAGYYIRGVVENVGGTVSFIGTPSVTTLGEDDTAWDVRAITSFGALFIQVQGNGEAIRWVATVRTAEVSW